MKEAVSCTLKIAYKEKYLMKIRELNKFNKTSEVMLTTLTYSLKKTDSKQIDYHQRIQRYVCVDVIPFPWDEVELVMLIRAYGGCLGTKSR